MKDRYGFIVEALEGFPKVELEDIRRFFGAKVPANIRKHEFVDRLGAYIVENPSKWLSKMLERDLRLLRRLVDAGPDTPVCLDYPDYPSVLETVHLLGSDTSDPDYRSVWIPSELYSIVAPHIDEAISNGEADGSFEMERAALGYLNLYGAMMLDDFYDRMLDYWEYSGKTDLKVFMARLFDSPVVKLCLVNVGDGRYVSSPNVYDTDALVRGWDAYPDVKVFRKFTPKEALEAGAGAPYFVCRLGTREGRKLVRMLSGLGYSGEDLVRVEHDIWMNSQMVSESDTTEAIFSAVTRKQDAIDTFEEYNACMEIVADYANRLPKWLLKGHSAKETNYLKVVLRTEEDTLETLVRKNPLLGLYVHPAPMDSPCPCGSGLSYRFCHGKRLN